MNKRNNYIVLIASLITILIVLLLIYYFPLQKGLAKIKLKEYMLSQGVNTSEIESIKYYKDTKQDGYTIFVNYSNDEYQYVYRYYLFSAKGLHVMFCDVYNSENASVQEYEEGMKYKPLDW